MPSLQPGMPGAKEVYGIAIIRDDFSIALPPEAMKRYDLSDGDLVLLSTTHRGEGGLAVLNKSRAEKSVFGRYVHMIDKTDTIFRLNDKAYSITRISDGRIMLNDKILTAYHLKKDDKLLVVKGALVGMSYIPVEIWRNKLEKHGFDGAIQNIEKLEIF